MLLVQKVNDIKNIPIKMENNALCFLAVYNVVFPTTLELERDIRNNPVDYDVDGEYQLIKEQPFLKFTLPAIVKIEQTELFDKKKEVKLTNGK